MIELQQQEKFHKLTQKAQDEKRNGADFDQKRNEYSSRENKRNLVKSSIDRMGHQNRTIDVVSNFYESPNSSQYKIMNLRSSNQNFER